MLINLLKYVLLLISNSNNFYSLIHLHHFSFTFVILFKIFTSPAIFHIKFCLPPTIYFVSMLILNIFSLINSVRSSFLHVSDIGINQRKLAIFLSQVVSMFRWWRHRSNQCHLRSIENISYVSPKNNRPTPNSSFRPEVNSRQRLFASTSNPKCLYKILNYRKCFLFSIYEPA